MTVLPHAPETLTCFGWSLQPFTMHNWFCLLSCTHVPPVLPLPTCDHDLHFFTDGSCLNPQEMSCRVASWAVVLASFESRGLRSVRCLTLAPCQALPCRIVCSIEGFVICYLGSNWSACMD
jgi:hypothetical protein